MQNILINMIAIFDFDRTVLVTSYIACIILGKTLEEKSNVRKEFYRIRFVLMTLATFTIAFKWICYVCVEDKFAVYEFLLTIGYAYGCFVERKRM